MGNLTMMSNCDRLSRNWWSTKAPWGFWHWVLRQALTSR